MLERERIHFLAWPQSGEARLFFVVLGPDLYKRSEAAHAHGHGFARRRIFPKLARLSDLLTRHALFDQLDLRDERSPELPERRPPIFLATRHCIQLVFHVGREAVLHIAVEVIGEKAIDDLADVGRDEAAVVHFRVFPVLQCGNDRRVSGRAADAVLFQCLHQRGFRKTRRRLSEMLFAAQRQQSHEVALVHRRQNMVRVVGLRVVGAFLVHRDVARLDERRAVGAQDMTLRAIGPCQHVDRNSIENRVAHL